MRILSYGPQEKEKKKKKGNPPAATLTRDHLSYFLFLPDTGYNTYPSSLSAEFSTSFKYFGYQGLDTSFPFYHTLCPPFSYGIGITTRPLDFANSAQCLCKLPRYLLLQ